MRRDKEGNTPLHLASRFGSLEVVHLLLSKCSSNGMAIPNGKEITPLGYALSGKYYHIARHFIKLSLGNPAKRFPDFKQHFPSLSKEQSLDHPVSIFVMGNKNSGKNTLIKSLQVEGYWKRTVGTFFPTAGVKHHSGGMVPSDVSSYGYGRAKFYELSNCRETTQEGIFLSLEKPAHSLFIITLSCKDELKDSLLFWLSFIHYQFRSISPSIRPSIIIAVVASFSSIPRWVHCVSTITLDCELPTHELLASTVNCAATSISLENSAWIAEGANLPECANSEMYYTENAVR